MTEVTQCPQCSTRFKVTQAQRESHQGMVRCGRCQAVFNAAAHLYDDEPSPQLALPIEPIEDVTAPTPPHVAPEAAPTRDTSVEARQDANDFSYLEDVYTPSAPAKPAGRRWPWIIAALLLCALLGLQAVYFYRVELSASVPALKPVLTRACVVFKCTLPLPQQADLLSIESSALETDPTQANVITLNALLRNRASYAMAYPNLELTLTSLDDKAVARRTFSPQEYLSAGDNEKTGLPANRETSVKLRLNTTDLKPAGYRLYLLYPQ